MSAARHGWAHIRAYCTCGGKLDARSEPPEAAEAVHAMFRQLHSGEGHRPCDAATARRARARHADSQPEETTTLDVVEAARVVNGDGVGEFDTRTEASLFPLRSALARLDSGAAEGDA